MFKTHTCIALACDSCGHEIENGDGGTAHYAADDPAEQRRAIEEAEMYEWHVLRDGRVFCTAAKCEDKLPACECVGDDCDPYCCPVGCPCPLHPEVKPTVLPETAIGGAK